MPNEQAHTREEIAAFLPHALQTALESYKEFSSQTVPEAPKDFKAHHDACKVAIAHIQLLTKLAEWADIDDPHVENEEDQPLMDALMIKAKDELDSHLQSGKFDSDTED